MWLGFDCPMCGSYNNGKRSCCAPGGSWHKKCGNSLKKKPYTWFLGIRACKSETTYTRILPYANIRPKNICSGWERAIINFGWGMLRHIFHPHHESGPYMCHQFLNIRPCSLCFCCYLTILNLHLSLSYVCVCVCVCVYGCCFGLGKRVISRGRGKLYLATWVAR